MKSTELRIGNYVLGIFNTPEQIELISKDEVDTTNHDALTLNQIEPIPLTEEWLLKFGFYTDNESWYYSLDFDKNQDTFKICPLYSNGIPSGMFSVLNCMACVKKIQFVHQLQNLYFCLVGEELTIKPVKIKIIIQVVDEIPSDNVFKVDGVLPEYGIAHKICIIEAEVIGESDNECYVRYRDPNTGEMINKWIDKSMTR